MRTIWLSLAWKEWHEHKWKLLAVTAILTSVTAALMIDSDSAMFEATLVTLIYGIAPISMFLGAAEAAGESTRGTMRFTQSLPISMRRVAAWKLVFGLGTCLTPLLITILLAVIWFLCRSQFDEELVRSLRNSIKNIYRPAGIDHDLTVWTLAVTTIASSVAASLFIWTAAIGVNRSSEVRAGAVALAACIVVWIGLIVVGNVLADRGLGHSTKEVAVVATSISPGTFPASLAIALIGPDARFSLVYLAMGVAGVFYAMLIAWFLLRFGASGSIDVRSKSMSVAPSPQTWLPAQCRSPLRAILWKQGRESGPIVLLGVIAILGLYVGNLMLFPQWYATDDRLQSVRLLMSLTVPIGFLLALIVGISSFDNDMSPKIKEFLRSRPIQVDGWFWTKYLTSLAILGVALYTPIVIGYYFARGSTDPRRPDVYRGESLTMLCFHLAIFATSTAAIVLVRQPIYAAILGVGALSIGVALVSVGWDMRATDTETVIYVAESATIVLATLVAWLGARYDWGRRG